MAHSFTYGQFGSAQQRDQEILSLSRSKSFWIYLHYHGKSQPFLSNLVSWGRFESANNISTFCSHSHTYFFIWEFHMQGPYLHLVYPCLLFSSHRLSPKLLISSSQPPPHPIESISEQFLCLGLYHLGVDNLSEGLSLEKTHSLSQQPLMVCSSSSSGVALREFPIYTGMSADVITQVMFRQPYCWDSMVAVSCPI